MPRQRAGCRTADGETRLDPLFPCRLARNTIPGTKRPMKEEVMRHDSPRKWVSEDEGKTEATVAAKTAFEAAAASRGFVSPSI